MSSIFSIPVASALAAGDSAGITGSGWFLISLVVIVVVAVLLIVASGWSDKSPYLAGLSHDAEHAHAEVLEHAVAETHAAPAEAHAEPPAAEPETAPAPVTYDDLVIIEGIGPKITQILNSAGITTFAQLAAADTARLSEILLAAGLRVNDPATWPEQAALAAEGKMDELQVLQDSLKGGRRG